MDVGIRKFRSFEYQGSLNSKVVRIYNTGNLGTPVPIPYLGRPHEHSRYLGSASYFEHQSRASKVVGISKVDQPKVDQHLEKKNIYILNSVRNLEAND